MCFLLSSFSIVERSVSVSVYTYLVCKISVCDEVRFTDILLIFVGILALSSLLKFEIFMYFNLPIFSFPFFLPSILPPSFLFLIQDTYFLWLKESIRLFSYAGYWAKVLGIFGKCSTTVLHLHPLISWGRVVLCSWGCPLLCSWGLPWAKDSPEASPWTPGLQAHTNTPS